MGPTAQKQQDVVRSSSDINKAEESLRISGFLDDDGNANGINGNSLRSSLKKRSAAVPAPVVVDNGDEDEPLYQSARRSVHWTDVRGGELCEIREFEPRYDFSL